MPCMRMSRRKLRQPLLSVISVVVSSWGQPFNLIFADKTMMETSDRWPYAIHSGEKCLQKIFGLGWFQIVSKFRKKMKEKKWIWNLKKRSSNDTKCRVLHWPGWIIFPHCVRQDDEEEGALFRETSARAAVRGRLTTKLALIALNWPTPKTFWIN